MKVERIEREGELTFVVEEVTQRHTKYVIWKKKRAMYVRLLEEWCWVLYHNACLWHVGQKSPLEVSHCAHPHHSSFPFASRVKGNCRNDFKNTNVRHGSPYLRKGKQGERNKGLCVSIVEHHV